MGKIKPVQFQIKILAEQIQNYQNALQNLPTADY